MTAPSGDDQATTGQLVARISEDVSRLVRDELQLATLEVTGKAKRAGAGVAGLGAGGLLALYGVAVLIAAAILGLAQAVEPWLAALIVGVVLLLAAAVAALIGKKRVQQAVPPLPTEALASVREDVETLRGRREPDPQDRQHDQTTPRSTP